MRRLAITSALVAGIVVALAVGLGASGDSSGYTVRAIFYNASNVVPGEDVKTAGAKIGSVQSLDVTKSKKAVVVFRIDKPGFSPFHADADCTIRPQSLIGEKYVECTPGSAAAPSLAKIGDGHDGAGQYLLPVSQTHTPIELDLVNDTLRMPYRQRLSIILNEFGTALAGRGQELSKAIHSANPALRDTDRVLAVLAGQNKTLAQLASDSDRVLSPLAARRKRISDFVVQANATGQATAERSTDLMRTFQRFPTFLRELKPTLADLGALSDEMSPVLVDLGRAAPSLNRFILQLGPFSSAATPALRSLGQATDVGGPALKHSDPLLRDLVRFGQHAAPVTKNLDALTASLDKSGGIERILDYIFFQATAINGFDGISHYLRAELLTNLCSKYTTEAIIGCNANFTQTHSIGTSNGTADASLQRLGAALKAGLARGATKTSAKGGAAKGSGTVNPFDALHQLVDPRAAQARQRTLGQIRNGVQSGRSPAFGRSSASDAALNYLLGNDTP